jgi:hypothetical protein
MTIRPNKFEPSTASYGTTKSKLLLSKSYIIEKNEWQLSAILRRSTIVFSVDINGIDRPIADIRGLRLFFYLINLVGIKRHVFDVCFEVKTCHYLSLIKRLELPLIRHLNSFIRVCFELVLSFSARQFEALGISEFRVYLVNK